MNPVRRRKFEQVSLHPLMYADRRNELSSKLTVIPSVTYHFTPVTQLDDSLSCDLDLVHLWSPNSIYHRALERPANLQA